MMELRRVEEMPFDYARWVDAPWRAVLPHVLLNTTSIACSYALLSQDGAFAIVNSANTPAPWAYQPKSGSANVFPQGGFYEGGLNLSLLARDQGGMAIPCFSTTDGLKNAWARSTPPAATSVPSLFSRSTPLSSWLWANRNRAVENSLAMLGLTFDL